MADLFKVMEREMLHSEHAAKCFIEAKRRDTEKSRAKQKPRPTRLNLPPPLAPEGKTP